MTNIGLDCTGSWTSALPVVGPLDAPRPAACFTTDSWERRLLTTTSTTTVPTTTNATAAPTPTAAKILLWPALAGPWVGEGAGPTKGALDTVCTTGRPVEFTTNPLGGTPPNWVPTRAPNKPTAASEARVEEFNVMFPGGRMITNDTRKPPAWADCTRDSRTEPRSTATPSFAILSTMDAAATTADPDCRNEHRVPAAAPTSRAMVRYVSVEGRSLSDDAMQVPLVEEHRRLSPQLPLCPWQLKPWLHAGHLPPQSQSDSVPSTT